MCSSAPVLARRTLRRGFVRSEPQGLLFCLPPGVENASLTPGSMTILLDEASDSFPRSVVREGKDLERVFLLPPGLERRVVEARTLQGLQESITARLLAAWSKTISSLARLEKGKKGWSAPSEPSGS